MYNTQKYSKSSMQSQVSISQSQSSSQKTTDKFIWAQKIYFEISVVWEKKEDLKWK